MTDDQNFKDGEPYNGNGFGVAKDQKKMMKEYCDNPKKHRIVLAAKDKKIQIKEKISKQKSIFDNNFVSDESLKTSDHRKSLACF